jgi:hypothetical protein
MSKESLNQSHSAAWIFQTWISFFLSITATSIGIFFLPVDNWIKAYIGTGLIFSISSTISLSKTQRDIHESQRMITKIEEAKLEKILSEHS